MHRVHPSLIVGAGMPCTHNIVTILIELHMKSYRVVRATAETVVLRIVAPRVDNLLQHTNLHPIEVCIIGAYLKMVLDNA